MLTWAQPTTDASVTSNAVFANFIDISPCFSGTLSDPGRQLSIVHYHGVAPNPCTMKKFRCAENLCKQRREADEASTRPGVFLLQQRYLTKLSICAAASCTGVVRLRVE
jgi:hypothetical protein